MGGGDVRRGNGGGDDRRAGWDDGDRHAAGALRSGPPSGDGTCTASAGGVGCSRGSADGGGGCDGRRRAANQAPRCAPLLVATAHAAAVVGMPSPQFARRRGTPRRARWQPRAPRPRPAPHTPAPVPLGRAHSAATRMAPLSLGQPRAAKASAAPVAAAAAAAAAAAPVTPATAHLPRPTAAGPSTAAAAAVRGITATRAAAATDGPVHARVCRCVCPRCGSC